MCPGLSGSVLAYASGLSAVTENDLVRSQKCPGLDDKSYGPYSVGLETQGPVLPLILFPTLHQTFILCIKTPSPSINPSS